MNCYRRISDEKKKLLEALAGWLDKEGQKQRDHREELEELLEKLKKKETNLEQKLEKEKNKGKHKQLSDALSIVRLQYAKGVKVLEGLQQD